MNELEKNSGLMNELEEKIIKFFNEIKSPVAYLLKNKLKNPTGGDLVGEEIYLDPYTIIYMGKKDISLDDEQSKKVIDFETANNTFINYLYIKRCKPLNGILNQLKSESYKIIYKNSKG